MFFACSTQTAPTDAPPSNSFISAEQIKPIIQERGKVWGKAITTKDADLLRGLYDENAHYLPNEAQAFHGREAIVNYWQASFDFLGDLQLNMETLEGTKALLYETGTGSVEVMGQDGQFSKDKFKYVNVWKLQSDGTYQVVIDTFNKLPNE